MKAKTDELGKKLFFLSPAEKRNSILLGELFRSGKAVNILEDREAISKASTKVKNEALGLVLRSTSYFRPSSAEEVVQFLRHSSDLHREGFPVLAKIFWSRAVEIALREELFELLLLPHSFEENQVADLAWNSLSEIQELRSVFQHIKLHMREPDQKVRSAQLAPLLDGILSRRPTSKRAVKLLHASRFRVLFFLNRYDEALIEANKLLGCFDAVLDQAEMLPVLGTAISLKLYLGGDISLDIAKIWRLSPSSPRIAQMRCMELCQIEWFRFAVGGDYEAGNRAYQITKTSAPFDLLAGEEKLVATAIYWGLYWALLSIKPQAFEELLEIAAGYASSNESAFEWVNVAATCHLFYHGDHDELPKTIRALDRIKTTWTATFILNMIAEWGKAGLSHHKRRSLIERFAKASTEQPDREQAYFDLSDYFELLSSRAAVTPRRSKGMGGERIATQNH